MENFVVTCSPGLEALLTEELEELGVHAEPGFQGAVNLSCTFEDALKVAFHSRIASKVLLSLKVFSAKNAEMLYDQVRRINWPEYFTQDETFVISSHGESVPGLKVSFASLKVKDAICDEFKKRGFERPNVDRSNPDLRIEAFFSNGKCELSLDLFREPLHRRSHKEESGEAPLRENRAAALLRFAGYKGQEDLYDPFCGSGTILTEAALIALNIPPGLARGTDPSIALRWAPGLKDYWNQMQSKCRDEIKKKPDHLIAGSDNSPKEVRICLKNLENLKLSKHVKIFQKDALSLELKDGLIASNPPFGDRIMTEEKAVDLLAKFCSQLKHNSKGVHLALFLKKGPLEKAPGLRSKRKMTIQNGTFDARFLLYDLF